MQIALLSSYEALIDGLAKAQTYKTQLATVGWGTAQTTQLLAKLAAIQNAEQTAFNATYNLSERTREAQTLLGTLTAALAALTLPVPMPAQESSFRYSTSMSSSGSLNWKYNSGGVWVTLNPSASVPPSSSAPPSSSGGSILAGSPSTGPGLYASRRKPASPAKVGKKKKTD